MAQMAKCSNRSDKARLGQVKPGAAGKEIPRFQALHGPGACKRRNAENQGKPPQQAKHSAPWDGAIWRSNALPGCARCHSSKRRTPCWGLPEGHGPLLHSSIFRKWRTGSVWQMLLITQLSALVQQRPKAVLTVYLNCQTGGECAGALQPHRAGHPHCCCDAQPTLAGPVVKVPCTERVWTRTDRTQ